MKLWQKILFLINPLVWLLFFELYLEDRAAARAAKEEKWRKEYDRDKG